MTTAITNFNNPGFAAIGPVSEGFRIPPNDSATSVTLLLLHANGAFSIIAEDLPQLVLSHVRRSPERIDSTLLTPRGSIGLTMERTPAGSSKTRVVSVEEKGHISGTLATVSPRRIFRAKWVRAAAMVQPDQTCDDCRMYFGVHRLRCSVELRHELCHWGAPISTLHPVYGELGSGMREEVLAGHWLLSALVRSNPPQMLSVRRHPCTLSTAPDFRQRSISER